MGLFAGGLIALGLLMTKPVPPRLGASARVLEVTVVPAVVGVDMVPISGRGTVRPKHQVNIIPQVSGRLTYVHGDLAMGKRIAKGDLLFEVDPMVYEAQRSQVEAEVRRLEASLDRADQEIENLDKRIANADQMLAIDQRDFETSKELYDNDQVGTRRDVDLLYQKYLRQKDAMIDLRSQRSVLPHVKRETQAQLDASRARLERAEHDLANTKILCPFDARVEAVSVYRSQVVTAHFSIATLTDLSAFELAVGIDPRELRWLDEAIRPEALELRESGDLGPEVQVHWSLRGVSCTWRGHVTRFERVDEATRTARLVVEIRDVDMFCRIGTGGKEGQRGLAIGMHCRADLPARKLVDALTVPRNAVYDNQWVYVVEPDGKGDTGRLARRRVPMLRSLGDRVLVNYAGRSDGGECELAPGERVVVSPLYKPVVGMAVHVYNSPIALTFGEAPSGWEYRDHAVFPKPILSSPVFALGTLNRIHEGG